MTCEECGSGVNPTTKKCVDCGWKKHQKTARGGNIVSLHGKIPSNHGAFTVWIDQCKWKVGTKTCSKGATLTAGFCAFHNDCFSAPEMATNKTKFLEWLEAERNFYGEEIAAKSPDQVWGLDSPETLWSRVSGFDPFEFRRERALNQKQVGAGG